MRKNSPSQTAFFSPRVLVGLFLVLGGVVLALGAAGIFSTRAKAQTTNQPGSGLPEVVPMIGPVRLDQDLRSLPYIPSKAEFEERVLTRYPRPGSGRPMAEPVPDWKCSTLTGQMLDSVSRPAATMPPPLLTFEGVAQPQSGCGCAPPDTDGDVGPNHYVQAVNSSFKVFDKSGNTLAGPTTYNSLFAPLTGTPCSGQNDGDPFVFYDHAADRWVISDFAFPGLPGSGPFYQCIAVSQTNDPVSGGWFLYALQHEPSHVTWIGDYPKFGMWSDPQPGGAYHLTVNLFDGPTLAFEGVRAVALDRGSMLTGGSANAIGFTVTSAGLGDSYSLVAANFRTGTAAPAGRDEMLLAIDSPATGGVTLTQVKGWLFHVDFAVPLNSTFGVGVNHTPNALITVDGFIDAFSNSAGFSIVPQQGTTDKIQTLGDKIMTPVVYQNRSGTESLWAASTVCTDVNCTGPTGVRWYQFNVTGGAFSTNAVQQQTWTNGGDGLWRFMPSIAVDANGNTAIGYSTSSTTQFPSIRYAGRLATDPTNDLTQGEAIMFSGTGSQTGTLGRWGDYSMTTVDPADGATFWHANEYYATTSSFNWRTRIGSFKFPPSVTSVVKADFNGDGQSDILWQDNASGARVVWLMSGTTFGSAVIFANVTPSWTLVGTGDFNGDGKPDVLWQNTAGQRYIWLMNGTVPTSFISLATVATSWDIVGSNDFNNDGNADILWQNRTTGQRVIWLMNGTTLSSAVNLGIVPTSWNIVGSDDFNGDGKPDILWQNSSGQRAVWFMNGTTFSSSTIFATVAVSWNIAGTGDFNGDGKPDILWQDSASGTRVIWILNGTSFVSAANLGVVAKSWNIRNF